MRPIILTGLLLLTVLSATTATAQMYESSRREPNFGIYATEAVGGAIGGFAVWAVAAAATYATLIGINRGPSTDDDELWLGVPLVITGLVGYPVGSALGTWGVGALWNQEGQLWASFAGAGAGLAVGVGVLQLGRVKFIEKSPDAINALWVMAFACPPAGAVAGYNLSRPRDSYGGHFLPGSVALGSVRDADGVAHPSLDVRLVRMRF